MVIVIKNGGTKRCEIKGIVKFNYCKSWLFKNKVVLISQQRPKRKAHNVYTREINKIALGSNDDKRLKTFDRTTTDPYEIQAMRKHVKQN